MADERYRHFGNRVGNNNASAGYVYYSNPQEKFKDASAYAHLGDLGLYGGVMNRNTDYNNPEAYAEATFDNPALYGLPAYEKSINTPLGQIGLQAGMLEDTPGIRGSYVPNDKAQAYAQALLSLLGR